MRNKTVLPIIGTLKANQSVDTLDVFVQMRTNIVVTSDGAIHSRRVPIPAVPSRSTSASCVRQCLERVPQIADVNALDEQLCDRARVGAIIDATDGAYGNRSYDAFKTKERRDVLATIADLEASGDVDTPRPKVPPLRANVLCGSHTAHLTDKLVEALPDFFVRDQKKTISRVSGFLSFLRSRNYHMRMLSVLGANCIEKAEPIIGRPADPHGQALWQHREDHEVFWPSPALLIFSVSQN